MTYLGLNFVRRLFARAGRGGFRALLLGAALFATPHLAVATLAADEVFARVNGEEVLVSTYRAALRTGGRQRFYHGTPPEEEVIAFRKEIGEQLVDERLLHQEALRLGIEPEVDVDGGVTPAFEERGGATDEIDLHSFRPVSHAHAAYAGCGNGSAASDCWCSLSCSSHISRYTPPPARSCA